MKKPFRFLALFMVPAFVIGFATLMTACGDDDDDDNGNGADVTLTSVSPESGEIPEGSEITLTFSADPGDVTVSGGEPVTTSGAVRRVRVTAATVTVTWSGGSRTLNYTLLPPDTDPPELVSSSPSDGDQDVEPGDVNAGGVVIEFNEPIARHTLTLSQNGTGMQWIAQIDGNSVVLNARPGRELVNERTYTVTGEVEDRAGNKTNVSITFTTKPKQ